MPARRVLLDTSFVVALVNRRDSYHESAIAWDDRLLEEEATLVLHWGILLELADGFARLNRRDKGIALVDRFLNESAYYVHALDDSLFAAAVDLYRNRRDKEWSLTDCVSFVLMERDNIGEALTADVHFEKLGSGRCSCIL